MAKLPSKDFAETSGFFVLRTPLLPFRYLLEWSQGLSASNSLDDQQLTAAIERDQSVLRQRLRHYLERPELRDAIFVASPSLDSSFEQWLNEPTSERGQKVERSLVRYFERMAARPTPFGLFAGCSTGTIGTQTSLKLDAMQSYRRRTRLDMDYLGALCQHLSESETLRARFSYRPNSTLYRAPGRWRYVESRLDGRARNYRLVAVEPTDYLDATLVLAKNGAAPQSLAQALVDNDPEVELDEAKSYVQELIDSQLLVPELQPLVTGIEAIQDVIAHLEQYDEGRQPADVLRRVNAMIDRLDLDGIGAPAERYKAVATELETLPCPVELPRLFQVDLVKPASQSMVSKQIVDDVLRAIDTLHRLSRPPNQRDALARFCQDFQERYGDREVSLVEALDEESGIGFDVADSPAADDLPLLHGLVFPGPQTEEVGSSPARLRFLLEKIQEAQSRKSLQIKLSDEDISALESKDRLPLPDAFAAVLTLFAPSPEEASRGNYRMLIDSAGGPSGARFFGRFCYGDPLLLESVLRHLRAEESLSPNAIFAEVVHLPEERLGNILARPVLREYEIPFLGASGAPAEKQIPLGDLRISVAGKKITIRSESLNREIIPRLTSAHNYSHRKNIGTYRFLCALQSHGTVGGVIWSWDALAGAPFLPRVTLGKFIFSLARWRLNGRQLKSLRDASTLKQFRSVQTWRNELGWPRWVALKDADNELPVDLDNVLSVETFTNLVKGRTDATIVEIFPSGEELCVQGPEGLYAHEIVIPFSKKAESAPVQARRPRALSRIPRTFPPGSDWLYAKLYTGTATADEVLRSVVAPVVEKAGKLTDRWFFIRYGDPGWHVRLRFHGEPRVLRGEVLAALSDASNPFVEDRRIRAVQLDTYEREVERYGGDEGVELSEAIFQADSEAVLNIVAQLEGDEGATARWLLTLRGIDILLQDLGFSSFEVKLQIMKRAREEFGKEFRAEDGLRHQLSDRYRKERQAVEAVLGDSGAQQYEPGYRALAQRSEAIKPIAEKLRALESNGRLTVPLAAMASSHIHMHANRLLRSHQRAQELVLYDFLCRTYESIQARQVRNPSTSRAKPSAAPSPPPAGGRGSD